MYNLFSTDGFLWRAMKDLSTLVLLNILTIICCLPIVTAGAALAAMHYILFQMIEDKEEYIVRSYFKQFRTNLKSATPIWLVLLVSAALLFFEHGYFKEIPGAGKAVVILAYAGALLVAMLGVWVFPLMAKFVYSTGACLRNAFILCISKLLRTLSMVVIMSVIPFVLTHELRLIPLFFILGLSLPSYFCALIYHPVLSEMIRHIEGTTEEEEDAEAEE